MAFAPSLRKGRGSSSGAPNLAGFDMWVCVRVDDEAWEAHRRRLDAGARRLPADSFVRAVGSATRVAALLGAVPDGSAASDQELLVAVAREHAGWAEQLDRRHPGLRLLFESQIAVYDRLRLEAIAGTPLDQTFMKRLHEMVCRNQSTYLVASKQGITRRALPKGRYKRLPNHAARDAAAHVYPGASEVAAAMDAFAAELTAGAYLAAHPVLQASYALHGLTAIHPFADGNGRVGRALASVAFIRALSLPFLFESDARLPYLDALRSADDGDVRPLVEFVTTCGCSTMRFALESAS